jgi:hypothetical protein
MYSCLQMNRPKDLLDYVIQTMQHKVDRVREFVKLLGSLSLEVIMKLNIELVGTIDNLFHDSL